MQPSLWSLLLGYIDPGSGSFIVQLVIAALAGSALAIKVFWRQITGLLRRGRPPEDDTTDDIS
jgi:hypothetical protein